MSHMQFVYRGLGIIQGARLLGAEAGDVARVLLAYAKRLNGAYPLFVSTKRLVLLNHGVRSQCLSHMQFVHAGFVRCFEVSV
jgi:hypothetical protein